MNSDSRTTIQTLKQLLRDFRDERDWEKFHDPKNLAEAISIEAAELLELFLWKTPADVRRSIADPEFKKTVEEALADVLCFSFSLANVAGIDVRESTRRATRRTRCICRWNRS
jgi:NTP pyrophosphatase (non-canonical NTP hydrolase)